MSSFAYRARNAIAQLTEGAIEAKTRTEAANRLKEKGLFLLSLEETSGSGSSIPNKWGRLGRRIRREEITVLTSQLATLLKAGVSLPDALKTLREQLGRHPLATVLEQVSSDVAESAFFSEALAKHPRLFPQSFTAAIRAGEEGGMLKAVLERLADSLRKEGEVLGRIRGALIYPIFLCLVGAATIVVLLTFVIPRFTRLFMTMGEQLPLPTRILLAFSGFMDRFWPFVLAAVVLVVVGLLAGLKHKDIRPRLDRVLLRLPWIGRIAGHAEIARMSRILSELLRNGVPILSALEITQGVMKNGQFIADLDQLRSGVAKGQHLAGVMRTLPRFTPLLVNMVGVGEQSGQLPDMLKEVAQIYESECERAIQAFTTILGPGLIVVLGGLIAFVISAILLPVFQSSTLVG